MGNEVTIAPKGPLKRATVAVLYVKSTLLYAAVTCTRQLICYLGGE